MRRKTAAKRQARSQKARLSIEHQQVIKEVETKSFEVVRLSRVKYSKNDYEFIDVRAFQRGYGEEGQEVFYPTGRGIQLKEELFLKLVQEHCLNLIERRGL